MKNKQLLKINIALTFFLLCMSLFTLAEDDIKVPDIITNEIESTIGGLKKYSDQFYIELDKYLAQLKGEGAENSKNTEIAMKLYSVVLDHDGIHEYNISRASEFGDSISKVTNIFFKHFGEATSLYLLNRTSAVNAAHLLQFYLKVDRAQNESFVLKSEGKAISELRKRYFTSIFSTLYTMTNDPGKYEAFGTSRKNNVYSYYRQEKITAESSPMNLQVLFINQILNMARIQNTQYNVLYDLVTVISERYYNLSNAFFDLLIEKIKVNDNLDKKQLVKGLMDTMLKTQEAMMHLDPLKKELSQFIESNKYLEWSFTFLKGDHFAKWSDETNKDIFERIISRGFSVIKNEELKNIFYEQLKGLMLDKASSINKARLNPGMYPLFSHHHNLFSCFKFLLIQSKANDEQAKDLLAEFILNGDKWISESKRYRNYSFNEKFLPNFFSSINAKVKGQPNSLLMLRTTINVYEKSNYANNLLPKLILGFYENKTTNLPENDFLEPLNWVKNSNLSHAEKVKFFNDLADLFSKKKGDLSSSIQAQLNLIKFQAIARRVISDDQNQVATAPRCGKLFL